MGKGFEGLYGLVRDRLQCEPLSGHIFLFCNARRNRLKLIYWDGSGRWVCAKRLQRGCFRWPEVSSGQVKVSLTAEEFTMLIGGYGSASREATAVVSEKIDEVSAARVNP